MIKCSANVIVIVVVLVDPTRTVERSRLLLTILCLPSVLSPLSLLLSPFSFSIDSKQWQDARASRLQKVQHSECGAALDPTTLPPPPLILVTR